MAAQSHKGSAKKTKQATEETIPTAAPGTKPIRRPRDLKAASKAEEATEQVHKSRSKKGVPDWPLKPKSPAKPKAALKAPEPYAVPEGGELVESGTGDRLGYIQAYKEDIGDKEFTFYRGFMFTGEGFGNEKVFETSADRGYAIKKIQASFNKRHQATHSGAHCP